MIYKDVPERLRLNRKNLIPLLNVNLSVKKIQKFLNSEKIVYKTIEVLSEHDRIKLDKNGKHKKPAKVIMIDSNKIIEVRKKLSELEK